MTPAQLNTWAKAVSRKQEELIRLSYGFIYSLAALIRPMIWAKRPPKPEDFIPGAKKEMTDEEMYDTVLALNRALGGTEEV